jgi:hypothetical protein
MSNSSTKPFLFMERNNKTYSFTGQFSPACLADLIVAPVAIFEYHRTIESLWDSALIQVLRAD